MTTQINNLQWAIVYHCNSNSSRAQRWYHVSRVIHVDGAWFELYWYTDGNQSLRGKSIKQIKQEAKRLGVDLLPRLFSDKDFGILAQQDLW